jgi:hypothetical protein
MGISAGGTEPFEVDIKLMNDTDLEKMEKS